MPGTYDSMITRGDAAPLIPEGEAAEIIKLATADSVALTLCRRVNMSTKVVAQPVLSALGAAYWVNGDTGLKQTSDMAWEGVTLTAEEIAAIVPVPEAVIADAAFPIWAEVREAIASEVALKLDQAVFAGSDKPPTWPEALIPGAIAAGNTNVADSTVEDGGIANDISETFDDVEEDGYDVTAIAATRSLRALLRRARDASGQRLLDVSTSQVMEAPVQYVQNGVFDANTYAVAGQFDLAVVGVRQDLTWKVLDQAVITDDTGAVILNLAQQDSLALRVTARFAFATALPVSRPDPGGAGGTPYPFAVLLKAAA
jgi:HK97 family phage major capsid protein